MSEVRDKLAGEYRNSIKGRPSNAGKGFKAGADWAIKNAPVNFDQDVTCHRLEILNSASTKIASQAKIIEALTARIKELEDERNKGE